MITNDQSTLLLYCCEDVKSHRSGGDTVPLSKRGVYAMSLIRYDIYKQSGHKVVYWSFIKKENE